MKLKFKTRVMVVTAGIAAIVGITILSIAIFSSRSTLLAQIESQLLSQGQTVKSGLLGHERKLKIYSGQLSDSRLIEGMFIAFEGTFYGAGHSAGQDVANYKIEFDGATRNLMNRSKVLASDYDFSDIWLIATSGQVVFALSEESKQNPSLGKNIQNGSLKDTKLGACYQKASKAKPGEVFHSGYQISSLDDLVMSFICFPKFAEFDHLADGVKKGDLMGVILARVDLGKINQMTSSTATI